MTGNGRGQYLLRGNTVQVGPEEQKHAQNEIKSPEKGMTWIRVLRQERSGPV